MKTAPVGESWMAVLTVAVGTPAVLGCVVIGHGEKNMELGRTVTGKTDLLCRFNVMDQTAA